MTERIISLGCYREGYCFGVVTEKSKDFKTYRLAGIRNLLKVMCSPVLYCMRAGKMDVFCRLSKS